MNGETVIRVFSLIMMAVDKVFHVILMSGAWHERSCVVIKKGWPE